MTISFFNMGAAAILAAASTASEAAEPTVVADSPRSIDVSVQDCPLAEMLRRLCGALRCELRMEPGLDERVTLTLIDRDIGFVLGQSLGKAGYVITWKSNPEKIASISVFKNGLRDRAAAIRESPDAAVKGPSTFEAERASSSAMFKRLEALYASTSKVDEREAVVDFVAGMTSRSYEPDLIRVAQSAGSPPNALQRAAIRALSNLGTAPAVNCLLERYGQSEGKEAEELRKGIRSVVGTPNSLAALRVAAGGNKQFNTESVRVAAIHSLARFKDEPTVSLLKKLSTDSSEPIRQASLAALKEAGSKSAEDDDDEDDEDDGAGDGNEDDDEDEG